VAAVPEPSAQFDARWWRADLFDSIGQSEVAGAGPYYFNAQKPWFLWFCTRGVLINEGSGTARFRLDGSARVVAGESDLVGAGRHIPIPPRVGTDVFADAFPEYLLRPGDVALFEWGDGHNLGDWPDAHENAMPANPHGACFLVVTVFDYLSSGVIDHHHVLLQATPIEPVPGMQGQWQLPSSPDRRVGVIAFPPNRTYHTHHKEDTYFAPAPWEPVFKEWNNKHSPPMAD
jgi:hypothetical protein